jgi:hypothetical protein
MLLSAYVAICAMFRNEHVIIREWLTYHHWLGINKFYIFDHGSSPPLLYTIQDFVDANLVEYHYFKHITHDDFIVGNSLRSPQSWVYDRCFQLFGHRHQFIALIDADEFIVLNDANHIKQPNITSFLQPYEPYGGLTMYWQIFGSSGINNTLTDRGALASYSHYIALDSMTSTKAYQINPLGFAKSIINTAYCQGMCNPHRCATIAAIVNAAFQPTSSYSMASWDKIVLYHYQVQSVQEFKKKMKRGTGHTQYFRNNAPHGKTWKFFELVNEQTNSNSTRGIELYEACCKGMSLGWPAARTPAAATLAAAPEERAATAVL